MKFGGIFNKKGSKKTALKEDLAVSDPGSEDSWDLLYKQGSIQGLPEPAKAQNNPSDGSTVFPSTVNTCCVKDKEDEKGGKSAEKHVPRPKSVKVRKSLTGISTCKKTKQNINQCNPQSLIPVTSTPFLKDKRIPSFEVSPIISSTTGTINVGGQEDASPLVDSTASLIVKRSNPTKHVDAFDQLLDPKKNIVENKSSLFPGIQSLKTVVNQADTTRQYAGGIVRGVKTFQDQFDEFVTYNDRPDGLAKESPKELQTSTQPINRRTTLTVTAPTESKNKDNTIMQNDDQSRLECSAQINENPPKEKSLRRGTRGKLSENNVSISSVPKGPESNRESTLEKPEPCKKTVRHSGSKHLGASNPQSPTKDRKCIETDQKTDKKNEVIERTSLDTSSCLASEKTLSNKKNGSNEQLNIECYAATDQLITTAGKPGEKVFCYKSAFGIQIGNNCLKQSNIFAFAIPHNHKDQTKPDSSKALSTKKTGSENGQQLRSVEGCMRVQEGRSKNLSPEIEENKKQNPSADVHCYAADFACPSSLSPKSKTPEPNVKEIERGENILTSEVGCSSRPIPPSLIELSKTSPEDEPCAIPSIEKSSIVIQKSTHIAGNSNEVVSSSEEERILLRAQSVKLRENQSNSSRVTKSPKIIDSGPLGGNSKVLGRKLRFSVPLLSPTKHSEAVEQKEPGTHKGILSHRVRFDQTLNQEHECNTPNDEAVNITADSSFDCVLLSRNPSDMQMTVDDNFELEIMSSSEEENQHSKKHKKDINLQNLQEKTKFKKRGSSLSSRVKEIRQRKEAQIDALLNSKENESDSDSQDTVLSAAKDGQVRKSLEPGSGKKTGENERLSKARRHVRQMKTSTIIPNEEPEITPKNTKNSGENVYESPSNDDNHMSNEQLMKDFPSEKDKHVPTGSQNESNTKQLMNLVIKSNVKNRAMKIQSTKQSSRRKTKQRDNHRSTPSNSNGKDISGHRYSQRVRRPPSMYWLGKNTHISAVDIESETLTEHDDDDHDPIPSQVLTDDDDRRKSKSQKRKLSKSSKPTNVKSSKKRKSSESENSSPNIGSLPIPALNNVLIGSVNQDFTCSENKVQVFKCVQGNGVKGEMLALGIGSKYDQVFYHYNQVFYVLEGDISYECSGDTATLKSGSFFIVPHDKQYTISNVSNSTAKLLVVTCKT